jgi:hypothetical protein
MDVAPTHLGADKTAHHRPYDAQENGARQAHRYISGHEETSQDPGHQAEQSML